MLMAEMEFRRAVCWPKRAYIGDSGSKMTILRPAYYGDSERNFRVFEATLLWGNIEDRTAGKQRERDRVREIPEFPKPLAPALRFGSMNPISRVWVHGSVGERRTWWNSALYLDKKL